MTRAKENLSLVFYVGTHRLCGILVECISDSPRIARLADLKNAEGFQKGGISQLEKALVSVGEVLRRLELGDEAFEIPVYVLISSSHLKMARFSSSVSYAGYPRVVTSREVEQVIEQTRNVAPLPLEDWILQVIPESFWVNDLAGIQDPIGLEAQRLAVTLQIYTANYAHFRNLARVFDTFEFNLKGYFPKTLFLAEGSLNAGEKEGETLVVDFSDGVTHLVLTREGRIVLTKSLDFGSNLLTERIAKRWQVSQRDAERLKERFGSVDRSPNFSEELVPLVERDGGEKRQIKRSEFHEAFLSFGDELCSRIEKEVIGFLEQARVQHPAFVLTGGGARLEGLLELVGCKFASPVRLGTPRPMETSVEVMVDPAWAGVLGFIRWMSGKVLQETASFARENPFGRVYLQWKEWLAAYF